MSAFKEKRAVTDRAYSLWSLSCIATCMRGRTYSLFGLILLFTVTMLAGQIRVMPGSVVRGEQVLTAKGCSNCHDLAHTAARNHTPERFAAEMWNHMPIMWSEFKTANIPAVTLSS